MKRKFTNVFFLVAIAVAAMTSFVSCKDYEEDLWNESNAQYKNLDQSLKDLRDNLEGRVSALEAFKTQQEGINADLQRQIDELRGQIALIKQCECNLDDYLKKGDINLDEYAKKSELEALERVVASHTSQIATLTGQLADGLTRIGVLEEAIAKIKSCECNLDALVDRIVKIEGRLDDFLTEEDLENYVTRGELRDSVNAIRTDVLTLRTEISRVESIAQAAFDLATRDSARIDYVINLAKNDSVEIVKIWDAIKKIEMPGAYDDTEIRNLIQKNTDRIDNLEKLVDPIAGQISNLQDQINKIKQCNCDLSNLATKDELAAVEKTANDALALAKQDSIRIDNLKSLYDDLKAWADALVIPEPGTTYDDQWIKDQFSSIQDQFDADKARMDVLGDSIKDVLASLEPIKQSITDLEESLREKIKADSTYLKGLIDAISFEPGAPYNDQWIRDFKEEAMPLLQQIPGLAQDISDIQSEIADLPEVRENITNLQNDLATEKQRIDNIDKDLADLTGVVNALSDKMNKLITSIVVQDVTNPVYGTVNTPFGITSNVLISYYGNNKAQDFKFPTTIEDLYYNKKKVLEDVSVASKVTVNEGLLFENAEGNAGTVYLTVNPTNVDFSGTTFSLVNSRDEESPIKLGALQKSDRLINLGWNVTRADNGLYSATATINSDFAKAAPHIGLTEDDLKAAYQDFKAAYKEAKKGKKANFRQFASDVFSASGHLSGILKSSAPAYGIKAAWNAGGENYATYSKYELAAISVSPLSYASALKLDEQNPAQKGIDALEKAVSRIASTIQKQITKRTDKMIFDVDQISHITNTGFDITVTNAEITKLEGLTVTIPYSDIHEMYIVNPETGEEVPLETDGHQDITAKVVAASNNKLTFQFEKGLSDYFKNMEALLKYLYNSETERGYFDDLNDMLKWMGGYKGSKGVVDQLGDKVIDYIEDFAPTFVRFMKPSDWLQPLAFVSDDGSWKPLTSAYKDSPRVIKDTNPILYLTSRTGELLVPAYKKWIAVTNVFNEDGTPAPTSVRDAANTGNINKVIPGYIRKTSISLQKGYVYEISFQCVDYSGIVSAKQYYVKVK